MRARDRRLLISLLFLSACASTHTPQPVSPLVAALDANAPRWLVQHDVPSIAVAYVRNGIVEWTRAYGEQAQGVPATPQTLYNIASLTKPVFAETILRLAADGRLSLDESFDAYWIDPDIAADPRHALLTPRLALSHRTGFANWRSETGGTLKFLADPNTVYRYSGEGYQYASTFAQRKTNASLDSLARQYVFQPLGMRSTAFARHDWFAGRVAMPKEQDGKLHQPNFSETGNAADLLYTTVGDYAAFLVAVMKRRGLPAALANQRDSVHSVDPGGPGGCDVAVMRRCPVLSGYGLGWSILKYPDHTVYWHTGSDDGAKTMVFYFPERREGAVLFTNGANGFEVIIDVGMLLFPNTDFAGYLAAGKKRAR